MLIRCCSASAMDSAVVAIATMIHSKSAGMATNLAKLFGPASRRWRRGRCGPGDLQRDRRPGQGLDPTEQPRAEQGGVGERHDRQRGGQLGQQLGQVGQISPPVTPRPVKPSSLAWRATSSIAS